MTPRRVLPPGRFSFVVALAILAFLVSHCADGPTGPGAGGLDLQLVLPSGRATAPGDSISVWIEDTAGARLAGPVRAPYGDPGLPLDLSMEVPEGRDRRVRVTIDGDRWGGRGLTALGSRGGIRVRAAARSEVSVELGTVVPELSSITAQAGDLRYVVRWTRVPGALGYELHERIGEVVTTYETPDSALTFPLVAGAPGSYRVRAQLGTIGASVYTDSVVIDRSRLADLPRITALDPADGEVEVLDRTVPLVTFDRAMDWSTLGESSVRIVDTGTGEILAIEANGVPGKGELFLTHNAAFVRGSRYRIEVDPGLRDFEERPFDQNPTVPGLQGLTSEFLCEQYRPLRVVSVAPADGAEEVAIDARLTLAFNAPFDPASIDAQSVRLVDGTGAGVPAARQIGETTIELTPLDPLGYAGSYRVEVSTSVRDLRGEPLDQDPLTGIPIYEPFAASFRVETQPVGPIVQGVTPVDGAPNAPSFASVELEFSRAVDPLTVVVPSTLAIRKLPVGANIPGTLTDDGSGQRFTFHPATALEAGVNYRVVVTTGVRDLQAIPLDQDPTTPGFQPFQSEFRVERPIQVTTVDPRNNELRVGVSRSVSVVLTTPIDPSSLTESAVRLERGGEIVATRRSLSADARTATITSLDPLRTFTQYTVRVTADLLGTDGGHFDQDLVRVGYQEFSSRFTTVPESLPPMVVSSLPLDGTAGVTARPLIEVRFSKPILPASVNDETFLLRSVSSGALFPGNRVVAADSASATFALFSDLDLATEYEIEITNWVVDRFDVRLDQDPVAAGRQGFTSRFVTDGEHVPPRVLAVAPADSALEVALDAPVTLDFDEAIASATVGGIQILDAGGQSVAGGFTFGNGGALVIFQPQAPYGLRQVYTVVVDTTVTDVAGNHLDQDPARPGRQPFQSTFQTEGDHTGPRVLAVTPAPGAEEVTPEAVVGLRFSEPLDPATAAAGIALLDAEGAPVALTELLLVAPDSVALVPELLAFDQTYTVQVTMAATDSASNPFDQDPGTAKLDPFVSSFRTQTENIRPMVTSVRYDAPQGQRPPISTRIWIAFSEAIDPASLQTGDVELTLEGEEVVAAMSFVAADTLRIVPAGMLLSDTLYRLTVTGLNDLVGNPLDQLPETDPLDSFVTSFRTEVDLVAPRVLSATPADGSEGATTDQLITLVFSEPMDPSTIIIPHLQVIRIDGSQEFPVGGTIMAAPDLTTFSFLGDNPLLRGFPHQVRVDFFAEDLAGNPLDQDPETPENESFVAEFLVGSRPVADAGPSSCDPADSSVVRVDGRMSFDPDGAIVHLTWQWGDGSETEVASPDSSDFLQDHSYACADIAGCDGLDNDDDGEIDETSDCDESYRIVLRVRDNDGLWAADTIGVSFCGFLVRGVEPLDGATGVDTLLQEVTLDLTRTPADSVLTTAHFNLLENGIDTGRVVAVTRGLADTEVVLSLAGPLLPATSYVVSVAPSVIDPAGRLLDQDLCAPGRQPFTSGFITGPAGRAPKP